MASFCTKCGAALSPEGQFCTACGAPAAPSGFVQAPAGAPVYAQPPSSGNTAVKIILVVIAVLIGMGILSALLAGFGVWRLSRIARANRDGVTFSTPNGAVTTGGGIDVTEEELGLPIYPGAVHGEGGMRIRTGNRSMVTATYSTPDAPNKVLDFYKSKLDGNASVIQTGTGGVISSGERDKESWMITVSADPALNGGKTKIAIMHAKRS